MSGGADQGTAQTGSEIAFGRFYRQFERILAKTSVCVGSKLANALTKRHLEQSWTKGQSTCRLMPGSLFQPPYCRLALIVLGVVVVCDTWAFDYHWLLSWLVSSRYTCHQWPSNLMFLGTKFIEDESPHLFLLSVFCLQEAQASQFHLNDSLIGQRIWHNNLESMSVVASQKERHQNLLLRIFWHLEWLKMRMKQLNFLDHIFSSNKCTCTPHRSLSISCSICTECHMIPFST